MSNWTSLLMPRPLCDPLAVRGWQQAGHLMLVARIGVVIGKPVL